MFNLEKRHNRVVAKQPEVPGRLESVMHFGRERECARVIYTPHLEPLDLDTHKATKLALELHAQLRLILSKNLVAPDALLRGLLSTQLMLSSPRSGGGGISNPSGPH
eukprot:231862-Pelagomonas_calceolata.AAC.1